MWLGRADWTVQVKDDGDSVDSEMGEVLGWWTGRENEVNGDGYRKQGRDDLWLMVMLFGAHIGGYNEEIGWVLWEWKSGLGDSWWWGCQVQTRKIIMKLVDSMNDADRWDGNPFEWQLKWWPRHDTNRFYHSRIVVQRLSHSIAPQFAYMLMRAGCK